MAALATFLASPSAEVLARVEQQWGRDPARFIEPVDDVLAFNFRAALMSKLVRDEPEPEPEATEPEERFAVVTDLERLMHRG